jgi:Arc/MetJ-type ribon-helix-helix transcriptional regulator
MKTKTRSNFYVDKNRIKALKQLAAEEETSISELVREGIDRVISERMNRQPGERAELRAKVEAFFLQYAGSGPERSDEEIEDLVSEASEIQRRVLHPHAIA